MYIPNVCDAYLLLVLCFSFFFVYTSMVFLSLRARVTHFILTFVSYFTLRY